MKKANPREEASPKTQANYNTKSEGYSRETCFYCGEAPCLHHAIECEQILIVALCYQHTKELMQQGAAAFFEQLKKDAGLGGGK